MHQAKFSDLEPVFNPKSIAVVGASKDKQRLSNRTLLNIIKFFKGAVYAVNPSANKILGVDCYPDIDKIPYPVDYVIVHVPAQHILSVINDCTGKGVKVVQIFTAGFAESGEEEGRKLEKEIVKKAREGEFRIIGPNCFGVYCPANSMPYGPVASMGKPGTVAFLSQSGHFAGCFFQIASNRMIHISKLVNYGNGCDLTDVDFLEYLATDTDTEIIGAYIEGTRAGKRLLRIIRKMSKKKPLIILKGGKTGAGAEMAASHTGSLAGTDAVWNAALKQSGAVAAESFEELVDTIVAFQSLKKFAGNNVAVLAGLIAGGGGVVVTATDTLTELGFNVPGFPDQTRQQLKDIIPPVGGMTRNPVDMAQAVAVNIETLNKTLERVLNEPEIDLVMIDEPPITGFLPAEAVHAINDVFINFRKNQTKPLVVVSSPWVAETERLPVEQKLLDARIPVFPTFERAAKAIGHMRNYSQSLAAS